ncbi:hypothetical protein TNCV_2892741 [Trichonephila clavipes]|nr:hypothetical protein TNCV_2892741 [Trichonephila clavipes]
MWEQSLHFSSGSWTMREATSLGRAPMRDRVPTDLHQDPKASFTVRISLTENNLAVLNHKILEANSQVQNVELGGHQKCLSINRLWHKLYDMLRRLVVKTAPGHHDCSIQEGKS